MGNQGNRQEMPPPPINQSSSLMAVQPRAIAGELDISMTQPATFDIQNLQLALTRSQQTSSSTGLRCGNALERTQQPEALFTRCHARPPGSTCTRMWASCSPPGHSPELCRGLAITSRHTISAGRESIDPLAEMIVQCERLCLSLNGLSQKKN